VESIQIPQRIIEGDVAGWLRDEMNARRMSARMVGLRAGINRTSVTKLLHGGRQPTLTTTVALVRLFGSDRISELATNGQGLVGQPADLSLRSSQSA
jgi:hypothetical protein